VAIRALAHPLRLDLMTIIARLGRATTADAAREMGISHGLASHHLRQLAKYGFLEQVKGKDHRERPWRLVATSYNWSGARATAEGSVAVDVLEQMNTERTVEAFLDWQQRRKDWPRAWHEHTGIGESTVHLTHAELAGIVEAMDALLVRYIDERPIDDVGTMIAANLLLAAGLLPLLLVRGAAQVWIVFAVMFWEGAVQQFFSPAEKAMVPGWCPTTNS
jgi:DNA-binding transcriptional ArsR family regulator